MMESKTHIVLGVLFTLLIAMMGWDNVQDDRMINEMRKSSTRIAQLSVQLENAVETHLRHTADGHPFTVQREFAQTLQNLNERLINLENTLQNHVVNDE